MAPQHTAEMDGQDDHINSPDHGENSDNGVAVLWSCVNYSISHIFQITDKYSLNTKTLKFSSISLIRASDLNIVS